MFWLLFAGCVGAYYNDSQQYQSGALGAFVGESYMTTGFQSPILNIVGNPTPGYLFFAPRGTNVPQNGPIITDAFGELVWYGADLIGQTLPLQVFTYNGEQVLATWMGSFNAGGWGDGTSVLVDKNYDVIHNM